MKKLPCELLVVVTILLAACGTAGAATEEAATPLPPQPTGATSDGCPITTPVFDEAPDDPNADPFGSGPWFINEDRTIWAGPYPWVAGSQGNKALWIRPAGTELSVTGRRLDGDAPPLTAEIPCCYTTGFQVTGLYFPTGGCWEVTATAGDSKLQFVTMVK